MNMKQCGADGLRFRKLVDSHRWIFAKTYAAFCPHEYSLAREWNRTDFDWFVRFVWDNGFLATYGKNAGKYLVDDETGYYYFVSPNDILDDGSINPATTLINRSHLNEFEFVTENTLMGEMVKVKRLPPERRKKW